MKKIVFILFLSLFTVKMLGQTTTETPYSKEHYLQKAKNKNTKAWLLVSGGLLITAIGLVGFSNNPIDISSETKESKTNTYGYMIIGGVATTLISIPFFISSGRNHKKTASITLNNQPVLLPQQNTIIALQPTVSLKIEL